MELGQAAILTAFLAGVLSFLSPCVLTMLPAYTTVLAGGGCVATGDRKRNIRLLVNSTIFLSGFVAVFLAFGAAAFFIGRYIAGLQEVFHKVGAIFMIIMGLQMSGAFSIILPRRSCTPVLRSGLGPAGVFLLGVASTVAWAPCNGSLLAAVFSYFGGISSSVSGFILLSIYSAGFCIPFLLTTHCLERGLNRLRIFSSKLHVFQHLTGLILVAAGICLYFDLL